MNLLREIRARSGLTQTALAARAGTSRTRLSAYEHDHTDPELDTLHRIAEAARMEVAVAPLGTSRVRERVAAIAGAIAEGDQPYALRLVAELAAWVRDGVVEPGALDADPGSTGDRRWDALIGGVAEMLATELGGATPPWAGAPSRFVEGWWFVSRLRSVRAAVVVETPPALAARGVFVSRSSLESV
ncbi:MAG: helix-turn-helix transcriptional regulator [Actinomycetota bacterium]|nr:helix-turn-helix transcriptional regulator [Actinomycetota bacterium]